MKKVLIIIVMLILSIVTLSFAQEIKAKRVRIEDSGSYYTGTEIETALQEIGTGGGVTPLIFKTLSVSGQSSVVADSATDILTLTGDGILAITTNATTDTITFTATEVDGSTTNEINTITTPDANITAGLGIIFAQSGTMAITELADTITFTVTETDPNAVLSDGTRAMSGNLTVNKADPTIIFTPITATDTRFWAGVQDDGAIDDDDPWQIGKGTVPGTTPYFTISSTGNVGIGTTAPVTTLHVIGTIKSASASNPELQLRKTSGGTDSDFYLGVDSSNNNYLRGYGAYPLLFYTNNTEKVRIQSDGNVGIGTTGPGAMLHVAQSDGAADAVRAPIILSRYWASSTNMRGAALFSYYNSATAQDQLVFGVSSGNQPADYAQAKMVIQQNGNVGIGTTGPSCKLDVVGKIASRATSVTVAAAATTFAITSNVVVVTGDGSGNTVATITGGVSGLTLTLIFVDALVVITDTDAHTANTADLSAAFTSADDTTLTLVSDGTSWYEVSRSVN